ncbi:MAG: hypothetical protein D3924_06410 [Candidatus Electrothrix sp. AR4]|nr:hypothetical protein [Candidatus Electrothrix sp. AR4]
MLEELIEVKYNDTAVSRHLKYYAAKLKPARVTQLVATLDKPFDQEVVRVTGPLDYFADPPWAAASPAG